jgi:hypothetical protein
MRRAVAPFNWLSDESAVQTMRCLRGQKTPRLSCLGVPSILRAPSRLDVFGKDNRNFRSIPQ